jgi:hypothetical protein
VIFDNGAKNYIHWRKDSFFSKWCWEKVIHKQINKKTETGPLSLTLYKKNPNCIKYLNGRHETLKL